MQEVTGSSPVSPTNTLSLSLADRRLLPAPSTRENKSPATVAVYLTALNRLVAFLEAQGMPTSITGSAVSTLKPRSPEGTAAELSDHLSGIAQGRTMSSMARNPRRSP